MVDINKNVSHNKPIKNLCIEVAMQMSNSGSRQTMNWMKGNHRRRKYLAKYDPGVIGNTYNTPTIVVELLFMSFSISRA